MKGATTVVWDFGGVLFNWSPSDLIRRELPQRARSAEEAAHWVASIFQNYGGDWGEFDRGTVTVPELVQRIATRTGLGAQEVQAVVDGVPGELQPKSDSVALLRQLRDAGQSQRFLSNMPAPYADHLEAEHDFIGWFADGVFSGRVKAIKPEREIFDIAASRFGVPPAELLFFDDHAPNVEAARACGWQAELFTTAAVAAAQLRERGLLPK
jgi:HAD superfamily hydrolase (TIGR01509 family)